jgi:hypothetical protein
MAELVLYELNSGPINFTLNYVIDVEEPPVTPIEEGIFDESFDNSFE